MKTTRRSYGPLIGATKAQKSEGVITDHRFKEYQQMEKGSRALCRAILDMGKTHGPCDVDAAIDYAYGVKTVYIGKGN